MVLNAYNDTYITISYNINYGGGGELSHYPLLIKIVRPRTKHLHIIKKIIRYSTRKCGSNIYYIEY